MAAAAASTSLLSHGCSSSTFNPNVPTSISPRRKIFFHRHHRLHQRVRCCSSSSSSKFPASPVIQNEKGSSFCFGKCAFSIALSIGLVLSSPRLSWSANASQAGPVLPNLSVLISGPPIKDPGALLRYALPIDNKAIREVQKPLEDITESLKIAGVKALDSVERNVRQASRSLKQGESMIVSGLAESKKVHGKELLNKLAQGMEELQQIVEERDRDAVAPKQKELLQYVGD